MDASVLARWWGIENATLVAATGGHTNTTWLVDAPAGRFVLRRSWPGKPRSRAEAEERVLGALAGEPPPATGAFGMSRNVGASDGSLVRFGDTADGRCRVPDVVATRDGAPHVRVDGATLHLFTRLPGEPGPRWLGGEIDRATAVMTTLAYLHRALAVLPVTDGDPWAHLRARLARIRNGSLDALPAGAANVLAAAETALAANAPGRVQWLHGDFHLGNILWRAGQVSGVVDFDDVGTGAAGGEAVLAAFAVARRPGDDRFTYDEALFRAAIAAYEAAGSLGSIDEPALERVFCASQVLVHLEAAQRNLWQLESGIGFWACWHALRE